jgi:hypothetical protein
MGSPWEGAGELRQVGRLGGTQHRLAVLHQLADALAQFQRARRRHHPAPGPDQQRVAGDFAQARQRAAGGRRTELQPPPGARDVAFGQQHVEGDQQVEIGAGHGWTVADMARRARMKCAWRAFRQGAQGGTVMA